MSDATWRNPMPPGFRWPDGIRAAACFTFDADAESPILFEHPEAADWSGLREELGLEYLTTEDVFRLGPAAVAAAIRERVGDRPAFISFDIDVVDPAYAPGTGTPEAGGPSARDLLAILRGLTGIDFVGFDVVEVIPAYDPAGQTATLAANLAYEMLSLVAVHRQPGR